MQAHSLPHPNTLFEIRKVSRRKFLLSAAAAGAVVFAGDGFWQSNRIRVVRMELPLRRLPKAFDGFTIAQLSDFHYDDRFSASVIRDSVSIVNDLRPDLTVLTGDFITVPMLETGRALHKAATTVVPCSEVLAGIKGPKYAVLGNHDVFVDIPLIVNSLERNGIVVMRNQSTPLERGNARIWLIGADDFLRGLMRLRIAVAGIPPDEATIILAHEPDVADYTSNFGIDLQLSGHSHGGQVWIPGIGAPWLPPMSRKYPRGLYRVKDMLLYTNMGIGTIRAPIRINAPPEVTFFTLRSAQS